jgi:phosphoglycerate dehydrogenase-like enzyme
MNRTKPADTKMVICVKFRFSVWNAPPELAARIRERWPEMRVVHLPDYTGLDAELPDADIFVGFTLKPEQFLAARKLKWIHCTAAAVTQLMYPELRQSQVTVTNSSGIHAIPMTEHVIGTLIALARRFPDCFRYQEERHWASLDLFAAAVPPRELYGQTLLCIGFGAVGKSVAKAARSLGMRVMAVTRSGTGDTELAERVFSIARLAEALAMADFVVLAAPETPETNHMFGEREFAAMKPTAYFVNMARGPLVDDAAMIAALEHGTIAGASIDVATEEPLPADSPLWRAKNLFITPHVSAVSDRLWERQGELLMRNIERWFGGEELVNQVDLKRGY